MRREEPRRRRLACGREPRASSRGFAGAGLPGSEEHELARPVIDAYLRLEIAATVERLPEYATLRAMGAGNAYLHWIILKQSSLGAIFGYALGMIVAEAVMFMARDGTAALILPWPIAFSLAIITLLMCSGGAIVSIRNLRKVDPAMVFK